MLFIICVTWCQKLSLHLHGVRVEPTLLLRSVDITMAHAAVGIPPLQIDVRNAAKSWRTWRSAWTEYEVATDLDEKTERKRVSTLLSVIGREAKDIWENYHWINDVTIYGRGFGFILIILLLVGFYIQKSYVRFSYTFDRLDF